MQGRQHNPNTSQGRSMTRTAIVTLATTAVLLTGCVPVPVIAPPAKITVGGGGAFGELRDKAQGEDLSRSGALQLKAGVHPMSLFDDERELDLGVGFIFEAMPNEDLRADPLVGGYLEGNYALWRSADDAFDGQTRLYLIGRGDLISNSGPDGASGYGLGFGLGIEYASWVDSPLANAEVSTETQVRNGRVSQDTDTSLFLGYGIGEGGIGLEVTGNLRRVGDQEYTALFASLILRTPLTLGILLIPIWDAMEND